MKKTKYVGVAVYESAKKNDKCFYIITKENGKPKYEKFGWQSEGTTAQMAYEYRMKKAIKISKATFVDKPCTFSEAITQYQIKIQGKASANDVQRYLAEIELFFGSSTLLEDITPLAAIKFVNHVKSRRNRFGKPISNQTIHHYYYAALRQLFNFAIGIGMFKGTAPLTAQMREYVPAVDNTTVNYFSKEEATAFLQALDSMKDRGTANLFKFAFYTGFRRGEIFKLEWRDIDTRKGLVILREAKSGKNEIVEIGKIPLQILAEQRKLVHSSIPLVFPSKQQTQRDNVKKSFSSVKRAAGITRKFRFHDLCHNFATMLLDAGADLYTVQHLLTHKDSKTTQKYAHLRPGKMSAVVDRMSEMILSQ